MNPDPALAESSPRAESPFDKIKRLTSAGDEYWSARDLMRLLGYAVWTNFKAVIRKAMQSCDEYGAPVDNHFYAVVEVIAAGKGARGEREDFCLSRYACYLIAMNGNPRIRQIAEAQTYFTVQTRRQELQDERELADRVVLRNQLAGHHAELHDAARDVGVVRFSVFHNAGCRGLYGDIGVQALNELRGLPKDANRFDHMGKVELAANELSVVQTQQQLRSDGVQGEDGACEVFYKTGAAVRKALIELGTPPLEDLRPEPSIKALRRTQGRSLDTGQSQESNSG